MRLKYFLFGVAFTLGLFVLSFISFTAGKWFKSENRQAATSTVANTPTVTTIPTPAVDKEKEVKKAIPPAIESGNFTPLTGFFTESVIVRIENSGCCSPQTPTGTVGQLEYLNSAEGTWDFDQESSVATSLAASYPEHYSNAFIAVSSDGYSVAFQFDVNKAISKVSLSASYKLLLE
jgi:hypothetical protein